MARSNFTPEIKSSIGDSPLGKPKSSASRPSAEKETKADMASDRAAGIKQGSPQDQAIDAKVHPMPGVRNATMPTHGAMPPDAHHVAAAASIAHAILGHRGA